MNKSHILKKKYKDYENVHILQSSFEDYSKNTEDETFFDVIISATAFHWIKPEVGYPKAYSLLKNNGTLAVFWHMSSVTHHEGEMQEEIRKIYHKYAPSLDHSYTKAQLEDIHHLRVNQISSGGDFRELEYQTYQWIDVYSSNRYATLLNTYSSFQMLNKVDREQILSKICDYISTKGGYIDIPQEVRLYLARK